MKMITTLFTSLSNYSNTFHYLLLTTILFSISPNLAKTQIIEGELKLKRKGQKHTLIFIKDRANMEGRILKMNEQEIVFRKNDKKIITLAREKVGKIIVTINKQYLNTTIKNLGYSPTAFNFKKGERKYSNYLLFYNFYSKGVTDNLSVTGGLMLIPPIYDDIIIGLLARTKITHSFSEIAHIGFLPTLGSFIEISSNSDNYYMAAPSVVFTLGKPNKFLNFSATPYFIKNIYNGGNTVYNTRTDIFSIGGAINIKPRWSLIMDNVAVIENYDVEDIYYASSLSTKIKNGRGSEFDIGFSLLIYIDELFSGKKDFDFQLLPLLSYSLYF